MLTERIDLELNAICNAYRNRRFCLFDTLRLVERDWDGTLIQWGRQLCAQRCNVSREAISL